MRKSLVAGVGLLALAAAMQPAAAADLPPRPAPVPVYQAPPPVYVVYSWTGCYIGGHGGGVWIHKDFKATNGITAGGVVIAPAGTDFGAHDVSSWVAGGQVGCNYQAGNFVIGVQGDYGWTDATGEHADPFFIGGTDRSTTKGLASITGRIGYAWDRLLLYVKGGGAWEWDDYEFRNTATGVVDATASETRGGWTVGVGGEYAFTDWLTVFAEYNYYDFGTRAVDFTILAGGGGTASIDIKEYKSVFKVGLNFKWGPAISARY
jgi:outer membrane immunogenic protein